MKQEAPLLKAVRLIGNGAFGKKVLLLKFIFLD